MKFSYQQALFIAYATGHLVSQANGAGIPLVRRQDDGSVTFQAVDPATGDPMPMDGQKLRRDQEQAEKDALTRDALSIRSLSKRQNFRAINNCPADAPGAAFFEHEFHGSICGRHTMQEYHITCNDNTNPWGDPETYTGSCRDSEICVDGVHNPQNAAATAYCVSHENFVNLGKKFGSDRQRTVIITPNDLSTTADMAEAVITGQGNASQTFNPASLKLEAQDKGGTTLPGGLDQCVNCCSIGVQPWPQGTAKFKLTVGLNSADDTPDLYFPLVAP